MLGDCVQQSALVSKYAVDCRSLNACRRSDRAGILRNAYDGDTLTQLMDRFDDVYSELPSIDHVNLWQGIAAFAKKPDCSWSTSYSPMHEVVQSLAEVLERCVLRNPSFQSVATTILITCASGRGRADGAPAQTSDISAWTVWP